jgi:hypothetical protein
MYHYVPEDTVHAILFGDMIYIGGHTVIWLRHYATSWKVAGFIPDEVIEFFT